MKRLAFFNLSKDHFPSATAANRRGAICPGHRMHHTISTAGRNPSCWEPRSLDDAALARSGTAARESGVPCNTPILPSGAAQRTDPAEADLSLKGTLPALRRR